MWIFQVFLLLLLLLVVVVFFVFCFRWGEHASREEAERERERERKPKQAPHHQCRARHRAQSHKSWVMTLTAIKSEMPNQLSHSGTLDVDL